MSENDRITEAMRIGINSLEAPEAPETDYAVLWQ